MRAVVQRVKKSTVKVKSETTGEINRGVLIFLAVHRDDTEEKIVKMADKISKLRIFEKEKGKMDLSVQDIQGEIMVVSQFTLYGNCLKGNRPSFVDSARPEKAKPYYEKLIQELRSKDLKVESGKFREMMKVELVNDGPVTIIIDL